MTEGGAGHTGSARKTVVPKTLDLSGHDASVSRTPSNVSRSPSPLQSSTQSPASPCSPTRATTRKVTRLMKREEGDCPITHATGVTEVHQSILKEMETLRQMSRSIYDKREGKESSAADGHHSDDESPRMSDGEGGAPKSMSQLIEEGRPRIDALLKKLQTQRRVDLVSGMSTWFQERLPKARRDEEELQKRMKGGTLEHDDDSDVDFGNMEVLEHMQAFFDKMEGTIRERGILEKDKAKLDDARKRVSQIKSHFDPVRLQEVQDEVKELREQLLGLDSTEDAEAEEQANKKRFIEQLQDEVTAKRADVEFWTKKAAGAKTHCRLLKSTLEQVQESGKCKSIEELQLGEDSQVIVEGLVSRLRGERTSLVRDKHPGIGQAEEEAVLVERQLGAYESKLKELETRRDAMQQKLIDAGVDGVNCILETEEVYRQREVQLNEEIIDVCSQCDGVEQRIEELNETIREMNDSASTMEELQPQYWANVTKAIENLLQEDEEAAANAAASLDPDDGPATISGDQWRKRLSADWEKAAQDIELQQMFATESTGNNATKRWSTGVRPGFDGSASEGEDEEDGSGGESQSNSDDSNPEDGKAKRKKKKAAKAEKQHSVAVALEDGCKEIWARIDAIRARMDADTRRQGKALRSVVKKEEQAKFTPRSSRGSVVILMGDMNSRLEQRAKEEKNEFAEMQRLEAEIAGLDDEVGVLTTTYKKKMEEEEEARNQKEMEDRRRERMEKEKSAELATQSSHSSSREADTIGTSLGDLIKQKIPGISSRSFQQDNGAGTAPTMPRLPAGAVEPVETMDAAERLRQMQAAMSNPGGATPSGRFPGFGAQLMAPGGTPGGAGSKRPSAFNFG